jgi:integrase
MPTRLPDVETCRTFWPSWPARGHASARPVVSRKVNAVPNEWDVVFCSVTGKLRDTSNTTKHVRKLLDAAGFDWAVGHTFRKTAATWMDADPNTSAPEVANQLGHKRASMTMDVYMSRRAVTERAALVL